MKQVQASTVVGVDVGKRRLDAATAAGAEASFANDDAGCASLVAWARSHGVERVGFEATGGYERRCRRALDAAGVQVVIHQPLEIRLFARLKRIKAKSDGIDRHTIAQATLYLDTLRAAQDPALGKLADQLTAYEYAADALARARTFLEHVDQPELLATFSAHIDDLKRLKQKLKTELLEAISADPELARRFELLQSLPGVGPLTAAALVARMPELGSMRHGQAASLLGVAPFDRDSGDHKGRRFICGGRGRVRRFVYLAALAAKRHDKAMSAFAARLAATGKPPKVILVAVMRKLVEAANLVLSRGHPWQVSTS